MCKTARIHQVDIQDVILTHHPLSPYVFRSLFRSHIARETLTYCHAPVHSCSRLIPCEERALTIRGFSAQQGGNRDVKFFLEYGVRPPPQPKDPPPNPSTREGSIIYCLMWALVSCNYSLPLWEGWGGVLGLGRRR